MPRTATATETTEKKRVVTATTAKDGSLLVPAALRKIVGVEAYNIYIVKIVEQVDGEFTLSFKILE